MDILTKSMNTSTKSMNIANGIHLHGRCIPLYPWMWKMYSIGYIHGFSGCIHGFSQFVHVIHGCIVHIIHPDVFHWPYEYIHGFSQYVLYSIGYMNIFMDLVNMSISYEYIHGFSQYVHIRCIPLDILMYSWI